MSMVPQLGRHEGSWIVTSPAGMVVELFERTNVEIAAQLGWRIETVAAYLGRINAEIRAKSVECSHG